MSNSLTLKEQQNIMLEMMVCFDKFCTEHNLRYFLAYGTLLGAIRHRGFIPWDDDVDFVMPREDYEKLLSYKNISEDIEIISAYNNQGYYHPYAYCNIAHNKTIMKESFVKKQTGKGIFCDIFPLDGLPKNMLKRSLILRNQVNMQNMLYMGVNKNFSSNRLKKILKTIIGKFMDYKDLEKYAIKIDRKAKKYDYDLSDDIIQLVALFNDPGVFVAHQNEYKDFILVEFEGYPMRAPIGYDAILHRKYGNYMELPPESERIGHHGVEIYYR